MSSALSRCWEPSEGEPIHSHKLQELQKKKSFRQSAMNDAGLKHQQHTSSSVLTICSRGRMELSIGQDHE